jgi:hypothetical protein
MSPRLERSSLLVGAALLLAASGCAADDEAPLPATDMVTQAEGGSPELRAIDDCDPVTFGSLCNPSFDGRTTLSAFFAELNARQSVGAWKYSSPVDVNHGRNVTVVSRGGEGHTFTVVKKFGGGVVQVLNDASGNPVPAPECLQPPSATNLAVASGSRQSVTTGPGKTLPPGHYLVQCCIHPWMRTEIDVRN